MERKHTNKKRFCCAGDPYFTSTVALFSLCVLGPSKAVLLATPLFGAYLLLPLSLFQLTLVLIAFFFFKCHFYRAFLHASLMRLSDCASTLFLVTRYEEIHLSFRHRFFFFFCLQIIAIYIYIYCFFFPPLSLRERKGRQQRRLCFPVFPLFRLPISNLCPVFF